jgi:cation:H+ antiporter
MLDYLLFVVGIAAVLLGAQWLVAAASRMAADLGVPPLIIGLTIVAFGTVTPELVISGVASAAGDPGVALGNVVGSNIANVGLVLGIAATLTVVHPDRAVLQRYGPLLAGLSLLILGVALTGSFERWFGALLLAGLVAYLALSVHWARRDAVEPEEAEESAVAEGRDEEWPSALRDTAMLFAGIGLLAVGAPVLVHAVDGIATRAGVPEFVIAATLIAVGTSIPELATATVAVVRCQTDIAVGNVVGSNILNLLAVLGLASVVGPVPVPGARHPDLAAMVIFNLLALAMARTGRRLPRTEGLLLLGGYVVFLVMLFSR